MKTMTTAAKTAKLIRDALKEAFPSTTFSVRSKNFAGGNSVDVHWTDGPTWAMVESLIDRYQSGDFDGMTDSYSYRENRPEHPTAKYVHGSRTESPGLMMAALVEWYTNHAVPEGCKLSLARNTYKHFKTGEEIEYYDFQDDMLMPNCGGPCSSRVRSIAIRMAVDTNGNIHLQEGR